MKYSLRNHRINLKSSFVFMVLFTGMGTRLFSDSVQADSQGKNGTPNFIVFLVDDMGWADPECYGSPFHETPNINQLAQQGMRFTDAYAACPVCSPTRASILTGKYPATLNLTDFIPGHWHPFSKLNVPEFNHALPHAEITFAEMLKPSGYWSGSFGKWHLGPRSHFPDSQGFDEMLVHGGRHFAPNFRMTPPQTYPKGKYLSEILTDRAVQFLNDNQKKPFVLYLPHYAVHIPLEAPKDVVEKYRKKRKQFSTEILYSFKRKYRNRINQTTDPVGNKVVKSIASLSDKIRFTPVISESGHSSFLVRIPGDKDLDEIVEKMHSIIQKEVKSKQDYSIRVTKGVNHPTYAAMVEMIDRSLGRVMKTLDDLKLSDNTVLIFTSDNGGLYRRFDEVGPIVATNSPLREEKGSLYEGGIRVPLIVRWPGKIREGTESEIPVSTVDLFPTLAKLAGVKYDHSVDGVSLDSILLNKDEKSGQLSDFKNRAIYWHYPHYHHTAPGSVIRQGDYKLIEFFEEGKLELYNLKDNISESNNLSEKLPEIRDRLHQSLKEWRQKVVAQMPVFNGNYQPEKEMIWGRKGRRKELLVPKIPN